MLYDLNSKESRELEEVLNEIGSKDINDLSNGALWIAGSDGYVVKYDIETEEITMIPSDVTRAFSVYDDANIAYAKDNKKHSPKYCMYQGEEGTVCVAKGGWTYTFYRRFATGDRYEFVKYS